jgi:hypothetical protein
MKERKPGLDSQTFDPNWLKSFLYSQTKVEVIDSTQEIEIRVTKRANLFAGFCAIFTCVTTYAAMQPNSHTY